MKTQQNPILQKMIQQEEQGQLKKLGTNKQVVFTEENGSNIPATQTIINPKVEGVIVTAEGANDANVKSDIVSAVVAVTGAQAHKVQVFSMN